MEGRERNSGRNKDVVLSFFNPPHLILPRNNVFPVERDQEESNSWSQQGERGDKIASHAPLSPCDPQTEQGSAPEESGFSSLQGPMNHSGLKSSSSLATRP